jgi:hypothetical protein
MPGTKSDREAQVETVEKRCKPLEVAICGPQAGAGGVSGHGDLEIG